MAEIFKSSINLSINAQDNASEKIHIVAEKTKSLINNSKSIFEAPEVNWLGGAVKILKEVLDWGNRIQFVREGVKEIKDYFSSEKESVDDFAVSLKDLNSFLNWQEDHLKSQAYDPFLELNSHLEGIDTRAGKAAESIQGLNTAIQDFPKLEMPESVFTEKFGIESSLEDLNLLENKIKEIDNHTLKLFLDTSQAISAAEDARFWVDMLFPETGIHKYIYLHYETVASPPMPFSEGMDYIEGRINALPKESTHSIKYSGLDQSGKAASGGGNFVFSGTININGASGNAESLVKEIEKQLANRWLYNRSELRRAMAR